MRYLIRGDVDVVGSTTSLTRLNPKAQRLFKTLILEELDRVGGIVWIHSEDDLLEGDARRLRRTQS